MRQRRTTAEEDALKRLEWLSYVYSVPPSKSYSFTGCAMSVNICVKNQKPRICLWVSQPLNRFQTTPVDVRDATDWFTDVRGTRTLLAGMSSEAPTLPRLQQQPNSFIAFHCTPTRSEQQIEIDDSTTLTNLTLEHLGLCTVSEPNQLLAIVESKHSHVRDFSQRFTSLRTGTSAALLIKTLTFAPR